jgi:glycosyltransferase involved in cell wall biosynthesis
MAVANMKVFMLGWEFPPFISGGLGTACYGLTKAMSQLGMEVIFALPKAVEGKYSSHVKMLDPSNCTNGGGQIKYDEVGDIKFCKIESLLQPYLGTEEYNVRYEQMILKKRATGSNDCNIGKDAAAAMDKQYCGNMFGEVHRYAASAVKLALNENFDVIHAHDWMTYPAGVAVAAVTGKPLVVHVHSTEFDRSGENVNQSIYDIERKGMHAADKVITVSKLTRNIVTSRYGVNNENTEVVYNAVEREGTGGVGLNQDDNCDNEKLVLFLGRITMQKGPEYFLMAAKKILEVTDNVRFVMAGAGDMMSRMVEMAANLGIGSKVMFTGFLHGSDVQKIYKMADLYVMPSVSEPFGIAPLEALNYSVPALISKQSGVSEVLTHVLKVDFWDVEEMANKIIAVLKYRPLGETLRRHSSFELGKFCWKNAASQCRRIYDKVIRV